MGLCGVGFGVWLLGSRFPGSGFRVWGVGFRACTWGEVGALVPIALVMYRDSGRVNRSYLGISDMEPQYWRIKRKNGEGHGNWDYMSWFIFGQKKGLGFRVYCSVDVLRLTIGELRS